MRCKQKTIAANKKRCGYRWFSRYVIAAMLVDENKRFLISSFCSSTSNCTLQHCYLCPSRLAANHLYGRYKPVKVFKILNGRQSGRQVFSINFANRLIPAKPKYLARLEIYKAFQDRLTILNRLIGEIY